MKAAPARQNLHDTRESWLRAATNELRSHFEDCGYPLPDKMRFAIAFPSTGRSGGRVGECWHADASADGHFEVIVRADIADPLEVLGVLTHELVHTVVPITAGHGKLYREAALKIGLVGKMVHALPGGLLRDKLVGVAEILGPLPHARLSIERGRDNRGPMDRPKKQGTRLLKAECGAEGCDYNVRLVATHARQGAPGCPLHGSMVIAWPSETEMVSEAPALPVVPSEAV